MTFGDMFAPIDQDEVRKRLAGIGLPGAPEYNSPVQPVLKPTIAAPATSTPALNVPSVSQVNPQQQADQNEFNRLKSSKPGVSQIKNPVLKTLATIGDVAGTVLAPRLAAAIPGTTLHHNELENEAANRVSGDLAHNQKEAATAETNARANALANPVLTPEQQYLKEATSQGKTVAEGVQGYTDATNRTQEKEIATPQEGYARAIGAALAAGRDPDTDPHVLAWKTAIDNTLKPEKVNTSEGLKQKIATAFEKDDKEEVTRLQNELKAVDPLGAERIQISLQGQANAQKNASRQDIRQHDKDYVVPAESVEKSYQMMNDAYNEYRAAKAAGKELPTGAQSMLALSTHLSTTFGNVKGSRITKDMISEHLGARGISDQALVAVQKLTNGDVLSPDQWQAFHDLIKKSRNLSWETAVKEAKRKDIPIDFLPKDLQGMEDGTTDADSNAPPPGTKVRDFTELH